MNPASLHALEYRAACEEGQERVLALLNLVHGINRGASQPLLGIDFPDWQPACAPDGRTPARLRVFGERAALEMFTAHPGVRRAAAAVLEKTGVQPCPRPPLWASLSRDNRADKQKPAYLRRLARRGDAPAQEVAQEVAQGAAQEAAQKGARGRALASKRPSAAFSLPRASQQTKQSFELRLKKVFTAQAPESVAFNSYGLCLSGALPQY
jgi:hypothetical protein